MKYTYSSLLMLADYNFKIPVMRNAHNLKYTYSHMVKILKKYQENNLITTQKDGRSRFYCPTEQGREVIRHIKSLSKLITP